MMSSSGHMTSRGRDEHVISEDPLGASNIPKMVATINKVS